jgi:hypothetical protein
MERTDTATAGEESTSTQAGEVHEGESQTTANATSQEITHVDQLTAAPPAPSSEKDTHVLVPNDHVSFLHRLIDDVEKGVAGAEHLLIDAYRRVFPRAA